MPKVAEHALQLASLRAAARTTAATTARLDVYGAPLDRLTVSEAVRSRHPLLYVDGRMRRDLLLATATAHVSFTDELRTGATTTAGPDAVASSGAY